MAHSIELLLDEHTDSRVRAVWSALDAAGLRSAATPASPTNRPHVTLLAGASISGVDEDLRRMAGSDAAAVTLDLGAPLLFVHGRRAVLAASVVPSAELLALHTHVHRTCRRHVRDLAEHCAPGAWTPHVTLARGVDRDDLAAAVAAVESVPPVSGRVGSGRVSAVRRWDSDAKMETVFPSR